MRMPASLGACRALLTGLALAAGLPALAQQPQLQTRPTPPADPAMEAAQRAFDALPEAERKAIQDDLIWASDFTATLSGSFGRRTYDSILAFERGQKLRADGMLDGTERALLAEAARRTRTTLKYARVIDSKTGAALGLPGLVFTKREVLPNGTRWSSADGAIIVETALAAGGAADLPAAYDRVLAIQAPGRRVTYKLLRPDFFVVSGEAGPRHFYTRYGIGTDRLSGYTISYPADRAKSLERVTIALANSFQPVPAAGPVATTPGQTTPVAPSQGSAPNPAVIPPGLFLTGLVIAPGRIATAGLAAACPALQVRGRPARLAGNDAATGVALIETDTAGATPLAPTPPGDAETGASALILGFVSGAPAPTLTVSSGHIVAGGKRIDAPLHREAGGSVVFDRSGRLIGLIGQPRPGPRLVAGIVPSVSHPLLAAAGILPPGGTAAAAPLTAGALYARLAPSLLPVTCGQPVTLPR